MKSRLGATIAALVGLAACSVAPLPPEGAYRPREPMGPLTTTDAANPGDYKSPRLISGEMPIYPVLKQMDGKSGEATIRYLVGADGVPRDFEVVRTDAKAYADHAIIAVRQWRFSPAMKDGKPIAVHVRQTFEFRLQ